MLSRDQIVIALLSLLLCSTPAAAQGLAGKNKKGGKGGTPSQDTTAVARKLLDGWNKKAYHVGKAGLKSISFKISAAILRPGQKKLTGKGEYTWDGSKGTLTWDDEEVKKALEGRGWSGKTFDSWFDASKQGIKFPSSFLTVARKGGLQVVTLNPPSQGGIKFAHFDGAGTLRTAVYEVSGKQIPYSYKVKRAGRQYLTTGWSSRADGKDKMSPLKGTVTLTHRRVGKYYVVLRAIDVRNIGRKQVFKATLDFKSHKVDKKK